MVDAGAVDHLQETRSGGGIFGEDGVGVVRTVGIDVADRFFHAVYELDGADEVAVFGGKFVLSHHVHADNLRRFFCTAQGDAGSCEGSGSFWQERIGDGAVDEQRFHGVAGCCVLGFGVDDDRQRFCLVAGFVGVHMADA